MLCIGPARLGHDWAKVLEPNRVSREARVIAQCTIRACPAKVVSGLGQFWTMIGDI